MITKYPSICPTCGSQFPAKQVFYSGGHIPIRYCSRKCYYGRGKNAKIRIRRFTYLTTNGPAVGNCFTFSNTQAVPGP